MRVTYAQEQIPMAPQNNDNGQPLGSPSNDAYNLGETDPEYVNTQTSTPLQEDWVNAKRLGEPLYIVTTDGKIYYVAVHGNGRAITVHPVIPQYEVQEGFTEYEGPDAWHTLSDDIGIHYEIIPLSGNIADSNIEAHVATVRNPIWFRVVQTILAAHRNRTNNPYR